jgi:hypothetical protein
MKVHFFTLLLMFTAYSASAQVTYASEIAEIIYTNCSTCHRSGEIGPMALTNYEEVKSWGTMIEYVTENRIMPPWQPNPDYSSFLGENYLTDEEIQKISDWVENGMLQGNPAEEPPFPDFPDGSTLGEPDLVLEMAEEWLHEGNFEDDYRYFVLPTNLPEDKIIKAVEFRPGNPKIVHHALVFEDLSGDAAANDAATPEYGFDGFGSFSNSGPASILEQKQFPGYVPGQKPIRYPDGVGQVLHAGADIVLQLHYAPWPVDESDKSKINIFFMDEDEEVLERQLYSEIMVPIEPYVSQTFIIPANTIKEFHGTYTVPVDVSLVNIAPHMHLLGKHWEIWMEKPGGEIVNLINIPEWDFNWQGSYYFDRYMVAPAGTVIHAVASYDNTSTNPNNPSNPPQFVSWGEGTTDEMFYLPIGFVFYQPGDEDIVFGNPTSTSDLRLNDGSMVYPVKPNPVSDHSLIGFHLTKGQPLNISIFDTNGKLVRVLREGEFFNMGEHHVDMSTRQLNAGVYFIQIEGTDLLMTQKFVKH